VRPNVRAKGLRQFAPTAASARLNCRAAPHTERARRVPCCLAHHAFGRTARLSPLLHIGLHKTGTSWIQHVLIPHPGNRLQAVGAVFEPRRDIVWPHPYHFDAAAVRAKYAPMLAVIADHGGIPVISDERLSGNPLSGGHDTRELVERLAQLFPDARVALVLREQRAMLYSIYDQYIRTGGACSIEDFLAPRTRHVTPWFRLEYLMFDRLIDHVRTRFGAGRLLVLPYERLRRDPEGFQRAFLAHAGDPDGAPAPAEQRVNTGRPPAQLAIDRRLNPFIVRDDSNAYSPLAFPALAGPVRRLAGGMAALAPATLDRGIERRIRARIAEACAGRFEASNRVTAQLTELDLGALGYAL
jgi:hypothetical protein